MISVAVTFLDQEAIRALVVTGHALSARKGQDIVCSAFTVLLRTFLRTVEAHKGLEWRVLEDGETFRWVLDRCESSEAQQYQCWCEFFLRGIEDLHQDAPDSVQVTYGNDTGRVFHGS